MVSVLVFGVLGFVSPMLPDVSILGSDAWVVDTWATTGLLGAFCAAVAYALAKSALSVVAMCAGLAVAVCAAMFAGPDVQGPGLDVLAWLFGLIMMSAAIAYLRRPQTDQST